MVKWLGVEYVIICDGKIGEEIVLEIRGIVGDDIIWGIDLVGFEIVSFCFKVFLKM